jgi:predicted ATP-grasp superfamily ATP-dependent carboligase
MRADGVPGVLILGGSANALSIGRSLGRQGVQVALSQMAGRPEKRSRWFSGSYPFESRAGAQAYWRELLARPELAGRVLLACDDDALEFLARERATLVDRFLLDDSIPELQIALLDKRKTIELARRAAVPAPRLWDVPAAAGAERVLDEVRYPAIAKPVHSHLFQRAFGTKGRKFFVAEDADQLRAALARLEGAGIDAIVVEKIPGPDSLLGSYYTYVTADGTRLFRYTKKIVRRYPKNEGLACCHVSEWDEELAALGERFFTGIGFRGFGNVEFKRDPRDGELKLIECNARFTAAQELLVRCGVDSARMVYDHLTGRPVTGVQTYRQGVLFWAPLRDFKAFRELQRAGELSLGGWLRSLLRPRTYPYLSLSDPLPFLDGTLGRLVRGK